MRTDTMRVLLAIVAIAASLMGCSKEGDLIVENAATTEFEGYVDDQYVMIAPGGSYSTTIYIGKNFAVVGPTDIGVTVSGSAWTKKSFSHVIWVADGEQTTYTIDDDVGALDITNGYSLAINDIRVKRCSDSEFGPDYIGIHKTLAPGDERLIQLDPGCWDVLFNYGRDEKIDIIEDVVVNIGQVIPMQWIPDYLLSGTSPAAGMR